jgi:hypothetical protein
MQTPTLQSFSRTCLLLSCAIALSGCAYWVKDKEQVLDLSGFQRQPADTPERRAELIRLPSHEFVRKAQGTQVSYTWADPLVCNCLWVGSDQDYKKYWTVLASRSGPTNAHTLSYTPGSQSWQAPVSHGYGIP